MINEYTIKEFLSKHKCSQAGLAEMLGVNQSAVHQMIKNDRDIRVKVADGVVVEAYEVRPIPAKKHIEAA